MNDTRLTKHPHPELYGPTGQENEYQNHEQYHATNGGLADGNCIVVSVLTPLEPSVPPGPGPLTLS
jgi:hypothetical protein